MVRPWVRDELRNFYLRPRSLLIHHRDPASRDRSRTLEPEEPYGLAQEMFDNRPRELFYAVLDLATVYEDDTIVAFERNGEPLETHLGAPARLRAESNHGYKMVKSISSIRWIRDYADYGDGRGGTCEDSALQAFNGRI